MQFDIECFFRLPVKFYFGHGRLSGLSDLCKDSGNKFLLVSSPTRHKWVEEALQMLKSGGKSVVLYNNILPNPTTDMVDEGAAIAIKEKCDAVIGLGGGSVMDAAKGIAVASGNGGKIWDYQSGEKDVSKTLPIITIPTTAGSGTDADRYFVLTNTDLKFKEGFGTEYTYPKISILDPELTESMPKQVTIDTAVDALGHSFEAYYSKKSNPFSDMISLNSIYLIFNYLPQVLKDKKDRQARSALMMAAAMGGIAIDNCGVATPHGISMAVGGSFGTTHGHVVGIALPYAVEKAKAAAGAKFSFMANYFGWSNSMDINSNSKLVVDKLREFMALIEFPSKLSQIGIKNENFDEIYKKIVGDEDIANDPGSYSPEEIKDFLKNIM